MRHLKNTFKVGRTSSHRRCMIANMLKSLIENERIETTIVKAKELRKHADKMITLAKKDTLASRRAAIAELMITYNYLTPKEAKRAKAGDTSVYNTDRKVINKLFGELSKRFESRNGGYTRIVQGLSRIGDGADICYIEYLAQ